MTRSLDASWPSSRCRSTRATPRYRRCDNSWLRKYTPTEKNVWNFACTCTCTMYMYIHVYVHVRVPLHVCIMCVLLCVSRRWRRFSARYSCWRASTTSASSATTARRRLTRSSTSSWSTCQGYVLLLIDVHWHLRACVHVRHVRVLTRIIFKGMPELYALT